MTKKQLLEMFETDNFKPELKLTDSLEEAIELVLKPHEDYFLGLHSKVKKMIEREIKDRTDSSILQIIVPESVNSITFADICNWQKELFEHKKYQIQEWIEKANCIEQYDIKPYEISDRDALLKRINNLPNQEINLGLRQKEVTVSGRKCPPPMLLEELKEFCFPIKIDDDIVSIHYREICHGRDNKQLLNTLTDWYKLFNQIHFFEDLNGRLGGIVVNILSHILTGKYVTITY